MFVSLTKERDWVRKSPDISLMPLDKTGLVSLLQKIEKKYEHGRAEITPLGEKRLDAVRYVQAYLNFELASGSSFEVSDFDKTMTALVDALFGDDWSKMRSLLQEDGKYLQEAADGGDGIIKLSESI